MGIIGQGQSVWANCLRYRAQRRYKTNPIPKPTVIPLLMKSACKTLAHELIIVTLQAQKVSRNRRKKKSTEKLGMDN
jgi:hypothetical protein